MLYLHTTVLFIDLLCVPLISVFPLTPTTSTGFQLRTKTDFDLVIIIKVEGSKLGMKSDYNCRKFSGKK